MRITFVLPDVNMGGGTKVLAMHAQRLQQRGHQVVVVATPTPSRALNSRVKSWLKGSNTPTESGNQPTHFDNVPVDLRILKRHRVITDRDVPPADVVIATWWETAEWVDRFQADKGAKAYFIQGYETYLHQADRMRATWKLQMQKIVVSKWLSQIAQYEYGDRNVCIVPNSVDLNQFHSPVRGKQQIPTVGMLYAHVEIKRCDLMIRAYELARRQIPNLRLVAFGNVPVAPHLPLPQNAGYWKTPPQDQIKQVYSQCDAWLFGSVQEGFGLPIVEAMACRTPVIATPAGAAPELLASGGGMLVKDGDPVDMARAIVEMVRMPEWNWREVSDAAYQTASGFTWDDSSKLFEAALVQAVERRTGLVGMANAFVPAPSDSAPFAASATPIAAKALPETKAEQPVVAAAPVAPGAFSDTPFAPPVEPIVTPAAALASATPEAPASIFVPPAEPAAVSPLTAAFATPIVPESAPASASPVVAESAPIVVADAGSISTAPAVVPETPAVIPEAVAAPASPVVPAPAPVVEQPVPSIATSTPTENLNPPAIPAPAPAPAVESPEPAPAAVPTQPPVEAPAPVKPAAPPAKPVIPTVPISAKPRLPLITAKPRTPQPAKEHAPAASSVSH